MNYVLVIFIYAGMLSDGDNVAVTRVEGFTSEKACIAAGEKSKQLVKHTQKALRYVCIPRQ